MLDGMSLADKLKVARDWFRRSRSGEFEFTGRHADTFEALLEDCELDAALLAANKSVLEARVALLGGEHVLPTDTLLHGAGGNVVSFAEEARQRRAGRDR